METCSDLAAGPQRGFGYEKRFQRRQLACIQWSENRIIKTKTIDFQFMAIHESVVLAGIENEYIAGSYRVNVTTGVVEACPTCHNNQFAEIMRVFLKTAGGDEVPVEEEGKSFFNLFFGH
jgi:hypothetical protein